MVEHQHLEAQQVHLGKVTQVETTIQLAHTKIVLLEAVVVLEQLVQMVLLERVVMVVTEPHLQLRERL
jgi:hypothetical protein